MLIGLREIEEWDLEFLRELRNANRMAFRNSELITPEAQKAWYANYANWLDYTMYAVIDIDAEERVIGTASTRFSEGSVVELGNLLVIPEYRHRGVMKEVFDLLKRIYPGVIWTSVVNHDNAPSQALMLALGFKKGSIFGKDVHYVRETPNVQADAR